MNDKVEEVEEGVGVVRRLHRHQHHRRCRPLLLRHCRHSLRRLLVLVLLLRWRRRLRYPLHSAHDHRQHSKEAAAAFFLVPHLFLLQICQSVTPSRPGLRCWHLENKLGACAQHLAS